MNKDLIPDPILEFLHKESTGGLLLILSTIVAMILANSGWSEAYFSILHHKIEITIGENFFSLNKPVEVWINDFLMAIFFFVIGLEIKREAMAGELSNIRAAILPISAAVGGMVVPALMFVIINMNGGNLNGWAVPMATDIAFSIGILTLLGRRIPLSLKIFLTALAIVDDLGGVLVIALFYTEQINMMSLLSAGGFFAILVLMNRLGVYKMAFYGIVGMALWLAVYNSGIHPTVAGILLAMTIPSRRRIKSFKLFKAELELGLELLRESPFKKGQLFLDHRQSDGIIQIYSTSRYAMSPVQRLEKNLHPLVAFFVMPLFALANAGIPLQGDLWGAVTSPISLGIIAGLFIGKQIGITLFTWLAVRLRFGRLPFDMNWKMVYGLSCIAGIGFTMSLFISNLAFENADAALQSKIGILTGSLLSGMVGWLVLSSIKAPEEKVNS